MEDKIFIEEKDVSEQGRLDPGKYKATIESAKHYEHNIKGHDVVQVWLQVDDPKNVGDMLPKYYNVNGKSSKDHFVNDMAKLGIEIKSRQDLIDAPSQLKGKKVDIAIGYNDQDYPVVYITGLHKENAEDQFDPNSLWT